MKPSRRSFTPAGSAACVFRADPGARSDGTRGLIPGDPGPAGSRSRPSSSSIVLPLARAWHALDPATETATFPGGSWWSNGGSNPQQTSGQCVTKSAEIARESATEDDARPLEVLALSDRPDGPLPLIDPIDAALADALSRAATAGRFDVVAQLALELEARRRARTANVVPFGVKRREGGP